jgi:hypothetical protein
MKSTTFTSGATAIAPDVATPAAVAIMSRRNFRRAGSAYTRRISGALGATFTSIQFVVDLKTL